MDQVDVRETEIWGWEAIKLTTSQVSLTIAPQAGGRVVSLTLDDVEAFFTLPELRGRCFEIASARDVRDRKAHLGWLHYGGYKTWLAPQERWTDGLPFLDLDSGSYAVSVKRSPGAASVHLRSPVCRETEVELARTVSMSTGGRITVEQTMTNRSSGNVTWGLWDVTQVAGPGLAVLPVAEPSQFSNGVKAYFNEGRSREVMNQYVEVRDGLATIRCSEIEAFKYGTDSMEGWIAGLLDRSQDSWLAYLKTFEPVRGATYPHEATAEVYDSGSLPYFELEVHSPLRTLRSGETYAYSETWDVAWLPKAAGAPEVRAWATDVIEGRAH